MIIFLWFFPKTVTPNKGGIETFAFAFGVPFPFCPIKRTCLRKSSTLFGCHREVWLLSQTYPPPGRRWRVFSRGYFWTEDYPIWCDVALYTAVGPKQHGVRCKINDNIMRDAGGMNFKFVFVCDLLRVKVLSWFRCVFFLQDLVNLRKLFRNICIEGMLILIWYWVEFYIFCITYIRMVINTRNAVFDWSTFCKPPS